MAIGAAALLRMQPYEPVMVVGNSMSPTFKNHEFKLASRNVKKIGRGDVVIFNHDGSQYIKRVALLEGDKVTAYYYAHQWLMPTFEREVRFFLEKHLPTRQVEIPKGELFVLGDNHEFSVDSRTFGPISADDVIARLVDSEGPTRPFPGSRFGTAVRMNRLSNGHWS